MKICTDIEQSKVLAEILPLESADMTYRPIMDIDSMSNCGFLNIPECYPFNEFKDCIIKPLPAWSLSALLEIIANVAAQIDEDGYVDVSVCKDVHSVSLINCNGEQDKTDNLVDACYRIIVKLKENNFL